MRAGKHPGDPRSVSPDQLRELDVACIEGKNAVSVANEFEAEAADSTGMVDPRRPDSTGPEHCTNLERQCARRISQNDVATQRVGDCGRNFDPVNDSWITRCPSRDNQRRKAALQQRPRHPSDVRFAAADVRVKGMDCETDSDHDSSDSLQPSQWFFVRDAQIALRLLNIHLTEHKPVLPSWLSACSSDVMALRFSRRIQLHP
jgi:hypothetical protein